MIETLRDGSSEVLFDGDEGVKIFKLVYAAREGTGTGPGHTVVSHWAGSVNHILNLQVEVQTLAPGRTQTTKAINVTIKSIKEEFIGIFFPSKKEFFDGY